MNEKQLVSFDYAIKYLLRDKGDYEIVEGFISALLQANGGSSVKILALLESESNREDSKFKRSVADLIVEDEQKRKYIIEIERNFKDSFIHKSLFNTSRLIIDNLAQREDYTQIMKVFHISLLYFPVGSGAIHHGETIIRDIETKERLTVHLTNKKTGEVFDATNILPEYFFISVPLFDDLIEKEIDEWLYIMKHEQVPSAFHSSYMQKVADKLAILKMTNEERAMYSHYRKQLYSDRDELQAALDKGIQQGREEGIQQGKAERDIEIAKKLLARGDSITDVTAVTGLSSEELNMILSKQDNDDWPEWACSS